MDDSAGGVGPASAVARATPATPARRYGARTALVAGALAAWFGTQALIAAKGFPESGIGDALLDFTAPVHAWLTVNPAAADGLLIVSSFFIDLLGIFLLGRAIFGPSLRPLIGLLIIFVLRQVCQMTCALPPIEGMIWRYPGFPSLLVTYHVSNDLFFSAHTALTVFGAMELARLGRRWLVWAAVGLAAFEIVVVLVLRAHYTMDVFTAVFVSLYIGGVLDRIAPPVDRWMDRLAGGEPEWNQG